MRATWCPFSSTWCRQRQIVTFPHHKAWIASRNGSNPMMDTLTWFLCRRGLIWAQPMWDRSTQVCRQKHRCKPENVTAFISKNPSLHRTPQSSGVGRLAGQQTLIWSQNFKCETWSLCCDLQCIMRKSLNCKQYNHGWVTSQTAPCHRK